MGGRRCSLCGSLLRVLRYDANVRANKPARIERAFVCLVCDMGARMVPPPVQKKAA